MKEQKGVKKRNSSPKSSQQQQGGSRQQQQGGQRDEPQLSRQQQGQRNEGEGNKTAARHYNDDQHRFAESGRVDEQADRAKQALSGKEGEELRRAEDEGRSHARHGEEDKDYSKQSKLKE
jgi:hypothetical protein